MTISDIITFDLLSRYDGKIKNWIRALKATTTQDGLMSKEDIIRKLTSRKFWLAVAAFVTELIIAFRGDAEQAETVSGIIMAGATVIAYIMGEGLVDAESGFKSSLSTIYNSSSVSKEEKKKEE